MKEKILTVLISITLLLANCPVMAQETSEQTEAVNEKSVVEDINIEETNEITTENSENPAVEEGTEKTAESIVEKTEESETVQIMTLTSNDNIAAMAELSTDEIVELLNQTKNVDEFDDLLCTHSAALGLNLNLYNALENHKIVYDAVVNNTTTGADFVELFNAELDKYTVKQNIMQIDQRKFIYNPPVINTGEQTLYVGANCFMLGKYDISEMTSEGGRIDFATVEFKLHTQIKKDKDILAVVYAVNPDLDSFKNTQAEKKDIGTFTIPVDYPADTAIPIEITDYINQALSEGKVSIGLAIECRNELQVKYPAAGNTNNGLWIRTSYINNELTLTADELLLKLDTSNKESVENFLTRYGKKFGITDDDLKNNLDKMTFAFTTGVPFENSDEFKEVYANYHELAAVKALKAVNESKDLDEFDKNVKEYASYLGLDISVYSKLNDKSGVYANVVGVTEDPEYFAVIFNAEPSKYLTGMAEDYQDDFRYKEYNKILVLPDTAWSRTLLPGVSQMVKFDIADYAKYNGRIASATIQFITEGTNSNAINARLHSIDLAHWDDENITDADLDIKLVDTKPVPTGIANAPWTMDITEDFKELIASGATEMGYRLDTDNKNGANIKYPNKANHNNDARLVVYYTDLVENGVIYSINDKATDVSKATKEITITFPKEVTAASLNDAITLTDQNNEIIPTTKEVNGKVVKVILNKELQYETDYKLAVDKTIRYVGDDNAYVFNALSFRTQKNPFELKDVTIKKNFITQNGLEGLEGEITASTIVNNNESEKDEKVIVMLGLYKMTERYVELVDIKTESVTLSKGDSLKLETKFNIVKEDGVTYRVTANVWDSLTTMGQIFSNTVK